MYETINEQVAVLAVFGLDGHKVRPFRMKWQHNEIDFIHVDYQHKYKDGESMIHVFCVSDGPNYYELHFDAVAMKWILGRVSDNEAN
jgi:hypothetical protein